MKRKKADVEFEKVAIFLDSINEHFADVHDYRRQGSVAHKLTDILFIAICAITCGANDLKAVAEYAKGKEEWLTDVLGLENGVPSYSTFWTVFAILNPISLEKCFVNWMQSMVERTQNRLINIDGKAQRGTSSEEGANSFVHIVSAWSTANNLTLGQLKVDGKSNELSAIPKLIELLDIEGSTITIDAIGCQKDLAEKIRAKKGNYIFSLKGNQLSFFNAVSDYFDRAIAAGFEGIIVDCFSEINKAHGRIEKRTVYTTSNIDWLPQKRLWKDLQSIILVVTEREEKGKKTTENRFYITCLAPDAKALAKSIRGHWSIENQAHWILDVGFREDEQNANAGNIAENTSLLRRISLNYLKQEKSVKAGIEIRRQRAGWDDAYLLKVLGIKSFS